MSHKETINNSIRELVNRYPVLKECRTEIEEAALILLETIKAGGKILICGNGGSSADADHIVGELMKGFVHSRPLPEGLKTNLEKYGGDEGVRMGELLQMGIPAVSLSSHPALMTAFINDVAPSLMFAQQVIGLGQEKDLLWVLSTSGNSPNIASAVIAAKAKKMRTLGMTGERESRLSELCDTCIRVKGSETYKIQELHLPVYHSLCLILEQEWVRR